MTVLSAQTIRRLGLVSPCSEPGRDSRGNSSGLSACGYDITLREALRLRPGEFVLVGAAEYFRVPPDVVGIVHDKSSLVRRGVAVQNTVLEPGWRGYLTLELSNHGTEEIGFAAGDAAAQVIFHWLDEETELPYAGKYQDQAQGAQEAR